MEGPGTVHGPAALAVGFVASSPEEVPTASAVVEQAPAQKRAQAVFHLRVRGVEHGNEFIHRVGPAMNRDRDGSGPGVEVVPAREV